MIALPLELAPPAPFPQVTTQSLRREFVAPGVNRAIYELVTAAGPLRISVVSVDTHNPQVRIEPVLSGDRLISSGETVSSMARRTGAVAGVNADYFDIGQTNQPLGILVEDGTIVRSPSKRAALEVDTDGSVRFRKFAFSGTVAYGPRTHLPVTAVNEFPPQGGVSLLTDAYGAYRAAPDVTLATMVAVGTTPGEFRIDSVEAATKSGTIAGPTLAFGPAARAMAGLPAPGDLATLSYGLRDVGSELRSAVGGGPLLVAGGQPVEDADAPAPEERERRFPVSGAALAPDGTLLLLAVDGRLPSQSVGLTRPEFAALMIGLGASDGMAFDSGGSATLVARVLGEPEASTQNLPSDGVERPVADGLFVYSDTPVGPPAQLVVRPAVVTALPGTRVPLHASVIDAAGHALGEVHLSAGDALVAPQSVGERVITVSGAGLSADVPVRVVARVASLRIDPARPVVDPLGQIVFTARAFDESGQEIATGGNVRWTATRGAISPAGRYRASAGDATIVASLGGASAQTTVRVGTHVVSLALGNAWQFAALPKTGAGAVRQAANGFALDYDFTGDGRAAYANGALPLPGEPLTFSLDVEGDGGGAALRAAFVNRFGEREALTLARAIDWHGWRRCTVVLPAELNPPVSLVSVYAVPSLGGAPARVRGTIAFRSASVVLPGTP